MIKAKHPDGRESEFTELSWELLGKNKDGWQQVDSGPPEDVVNDLAKKQAAKAEKEAKKQAAKENKIQSPAAKDGDHKKEDDEQQNDQDQAHPV